MSVPITQGTGASSVAAEAVGGLQYQQIQIYGGGGSSVLSVNPDGSFKASIIGTPTFTLSGNPSVSGTVGASIIGTVPVTQSGTVISSIVSSIPSSVLVGASIFGQLPAGTAVIGSVATLQGTSPWITDFAQSPSIVGTYTEDAGHTSANKGIFTLGVRNDTLSSITSADGDYSPIATGPSGETVTANAPITQWIRGTADLRVVQGASVTTIAAQGASVFTYITGVQLSNMGSASVLVTFGGGLGSILGYSIAPAGGGSNILYPNALRTGENSAFTASISGTASVLVSAQGFIAKI